MDHEQMDESCCESSGDGEMSGIRITEEQIDGWKTRLQEIDGEMASLADEKTRLQRKLAAVKELEALKELEDSPAGRPLAEGEGVTTVETPDADDGDLSAIDAVALVPRRVQRPLTPKEIKHGLPDVGFLKPVGDNYFYTALKRAVEKGLLAKTPDGRYVSADAVTNGAMRGPLQ